MSQPPSSLRRLHIGWHSAAGADLLGFGGGPPGAKGRADEVARPAGGALAVVSLSRWAAMAAPPVLAVVVAVAVAATGIVLAITSSLDSPTPASTWRAAPPPATTASPPPAPDRGQPIAMTDPPSGTPALTPPMPAGRPTTVSSPATSTSTSVSTPPATTAPPSGGKALNIRTNYAWAQGSVAWNGTAATATGQIHDTPQWTSHSWLRIAYKLLVNGVWTQRYGQPDPYLAAANGEYQTIAWSRGGLVKDVQWDLCSAREGVTYCTGWS